MLRLAAGADLDRRLDLLRHARSLAETLTLLALAWALASPPEQGREGLGLLAGEVR
jgi:hypothetical protein